METSSQLQLAPPKACLGKYLKKGNNNTGLTQIVGIVAYAVPNKQQKVYLTTAGADPWGRGCKGTLFNYCWPNIFPQGFQHHQFLSENGFVRATAPLSRCHRTTRCRSGPCPDPCSDSGKPRSSPAQGSLTLPFLQGLPGLLQKTASLLHTNDSELITFARPTTFTRVTVSLGAFIYAPTNSTVRLRFG